MESSPQYRELRPAVVTYLLHNGKVTEEAFAQTLLGLASDGWLAIEPQDSGPALVRLARMPGPDSVKSFERLALDRVAQRMGKLTHVPISVLTSSEGEDYDDWWKRFTQAVKTEAEAAGLARGMSVAFGCLFALAWLVGAPVLATVYFALGAHGNVAGVVLLALIPSLILVSTVAKRLHRSDLTDEGRAAALWWRQNGGGLRGALLADRPPPGAVPSPHSAEALVARGTEPLPKDHVWSSYGGTWRMVRVGPTKVSGWGRPATLGGLAIFAAFATIPASLAGHFAVGGSRGTLIGLIPIAACTLIAVVAWLPANQKRQPIPARGTFTGQVVKRWTYETSRGEDGTETHYCCCIDDGTSDEARSFEIGRGLYDQMHVGDTVYVDYNPRWHKVNQIQLAAPTPGPR